MPERAEIEAVVADTIRDTLPKGIGLEQDEALFMARAVLDRVRDARGECLLHSRNLLAEFGAARADDPAAAES